MKTIEEKAKAYDLAIDTAKEYHNGTLKDVMETIFPELKESEDEMIRKELIEQVTYIIPNDDEVDNEGNVLPTYQKRIDKYLAWLEKQAEQKPAESKQETKPNGGIVCEDFNDGDGSYKVNLAYLSKPQVELIENLVDSWQNPANNSVKWSEEDENMLRRIFDSLNTYAKESYPIMKGVVEEEIDWLKSLKQRHTWKPSDEQIENLSRACNGGTYRTSLLMELYQQLKKLREDKL